MSIATQGATAPQDYPQRTAVEFTVRDGLPNFFAKLHDGKTVKIAYLGGSITEQDGWRVKSRAWFQQRYPQAKVEEIHAAIGGTGSNLGVFRLEHDVLRYKPDLLFVEFAVNDDGAAPENIAKAIEGIVRQTRKAQPSCDICFIYTITERDIQDLQRGLMKRSESVMESIADHYRIPSVHFGLEVAKLEKAGKLLIKAPETKIERVSGEELNQSAKIPLGPDGKIAFSGDGVHPYIDTGHAIYMSVLAKAMEAIQKTGKPGVHDLEAPLRPDNWENAHAFPLDRGILEGSCKKLSATEFEGLQKRLPGLWQLDDGATLRFKFKGIKVAIYDLLGPDCGTVEVNIDGKIERVNRIDGYCTYNRLAVLAVADNLENKEHEVIIRALSESPDKRKILFAHNLPDMEQNPKKYQATHWYAGAIFIIGELVK